MGKRQELNINPQTVLSTIFALVALTAAGNEGVEQIDGKIGIERSRL